jgi:RimJ/RimL family protein N-acetyltransferase
VPTRIISNPARVFDFVSKRVPVSLVAGTKGLGLERDGELIAGVLYESFNGANVWMHVAAVPGAKWMPREFIRYCFQYPFDELGVTRISGLVYETNHAARRTNEKLGFRIETRLLGAAEDGSDALIYVMRREDCRFLKDRHGQE